MMLSACSTTKPIEKTVVMKPEFIHQQLPDWMIKQIEKPTLNGSKYKNLIEFALKQDTAIKQCNQQFISIEEFLKQPPSTVDGSVK